MMPYGLRTMLRSIPLLVLWTMYSYSFAGPTDSVEDRYARAAKLFADGQLDLAAEEFTKLTKVVPSLAEGFLFLGKIHAKRNQWDSAIEALERATQLKPQLLEAQHLLGVLHLRQAAYSKAESVLSRAVRLEPNNPIVHLDLGNAYMNQNKNAQAVQEFETVIGEKPQDSRVIFAAEFNLGLIKSRQGENAPALEHFVRAQTLAPSNLEVLFSVSELYAKLGRTSELESTITRLKDSGVENPTLAARLADLLVSLRREPEAVQTLQLAVAQTPLSDQLLLKLGAIYYSQKQFQASEKALTQALEVKPGSAEINFLLGKTYAALKDDRAILTLEKSVQLDPEFDEAWEELGRLLSNRGALQQAVKTFEGYVSASPKKSKAHMMLAEAYVNATLLGQAFEQYELARALDPNNARILAALGSLYKETGKRNEARRCLQKALELDSESLLAGLEMADIYRFEGAYAQARALLERAVKASPNFPECYLKLGQIYLAQKNFPAARESLAKAAALNPDQAQIHYLLAQAFFGLGEKDLANAEYERFRGLEKLEQDHMKLSRTTYTRE